MTVAAPIADIDAARLGVPLKSDDPASHSSMPHRKKRRHGQR
jgi:hypothetical protein